MKRNTKSLFLVGWGVGGLSFCFSFFPFDFFWLYLYSFIFFQVLQADGGNYCASVNAATLALIDAGVPLKDYVCACSAGFTRETALLDMNHLEESSGGPQLTIATLPKSQNIVFLEMNSRLHEDHLSAVMDKAVAGCTDVFQILDMAVRDHVRETAATVAGEGV